MLVVVWGAALVRGTVYYEERFNDGCWKSFVKSEHAPPGKPFGRMVCTSGNYPVDQKAQFGLMTWDNHRHYAVSARFDQCLTDDNKGSELVVQYTVKADKPVICGGQYIKLLKDGLDQRRFTGATPYAFMIGPDICHAHTHMTKFYVSRNGTSYGMNGRVDPWDDGLTHLLSLRIFPNGEFAIYRDGDESRRASFKEDFDYEGPRFVMDGWDRRPENWDDRERIPDPDDSRPADWDDRERIPDPTSTKPDDWDERDGEWEPREIPNPGFQGKWKPRMVLNPKYQGAWRPRKIPNPDYSPDDKFGVFDDLCYLGIDILQDNAGTLFDNFLVTDNWTYAEQVADEVWRPYVEKEKEAFAIWGGKERWERQREWGILDVGRSADFGKDEHGNRFDGSDAFHEATKQHRKAPRLAVPPQPLQGIPQDEQTDPRRRAMRSYL